MTMFHICLKHFQAKGEKFDLKMQLLVCLRIAGKIDNIESNRVFDVIKIYYESVNKESQVPAGMQSPSSHITNSTIQSQRFILFEKIKEQLCSKFNKIEFEVLQLMGYNFSLKNLAELLRRAKRQLIKELIPVQPDATHMTRELEQLKRSIVERIFLQISQVAADSTILPLSLYFEPEEIAAACIIIGIHLFNLS